MNFIEQFQAALPKDNAFGDIYELVSPEIWKSDPHKAAITALSRAGIFDQDAYCARYPDVESSGINALEHYIRFGLAEGRFFFQIQQRKNKRAKKQEIKPLISVIICVFNDADYVLSAVNSLYQSPFRDFEVILVDDGSTDDSYQRMLAVKAMHEENIIVLKQEHNNAGVGRNQGMRSARGQYLLFLDVDDIYDPDILLVYSQKIQSCSFPDIIFSKYAVAKLGQTYHYGTPKIHTDELETHNFAEDDTSLHNITNSTLWTKIFRSDFIKKYNIRCQDLPTCNDIGFCFTAMYLATSIYYINKELVTYRHTRNGSISETRFLQPENVFIAYSFIKENIEQHNKFNEETFYETYVKSLVWEYNLEPTSELRTTFVDLVEKHIPQKYRKSFYDQVILVSVALIINEYSDHLDHTIQSIRQQKLDKIELIIIDTCPDKNNLTSIQQSLTSDKRIRLFHEKLDDAQARNFAAKQALGTYIIYMEPGETIHEDCLKNVYQIAHSKEVDICLIPPMDTKDEKLTSSQKSYPPNKQATTEISTGQDIQNKDALKSILFTTIETKKFYNKEYFINNNIFFENSILSENILQHIKSLINAKNIYIADEVFHRKNNKHYYHTSSNKISYDSLDVYFKQIKNLVNNTFDYSDYEKYFLDFIKYCLDNYICKEDKAVYYKHFLNTQTPNS